jgi:hypothetical protein
MYVLRAMSRPFRLGMIRYVLALGTSQRGVQLNMKQVVYNRANAPAANETIVYTDDAIRPVFLIIF